MLRPTADAFVRAVAPAFNGGTLTRLKTRGGPEVITYLRFTVPAEIGTIDRAVLRLRTLSDEETRIVVRKATPSAWGETEITYASRPRLEHRLGRANVGAEGKWVKIDVSSLINGPGSYNITIVGRGTGPALFRSRESGSAPKLKVTSH